jgi:hypothetical protein
MKPKSTLDFPTLNNNFMRTFITKIILGLVLVLGTMGANAQITITVTGNTNTTPNLLASYGTLTAALTDLNAVTAMTGPVIFTCDAGTSETAPPTGFVIGSATLNPVLSAANTVTIVKAGGTVTINAGIGTATPASAAPDGIISIRGADYITIDGLTLTDGNAANPGTMEFGIGLFKLSLSDGASNNTIKNCTITVKTINNASGTTPMIEGSVGILVINSTATAATTALTPTTAAGTNSNNKFYTNTINGGNYGMGLIGFAGATPFTTCDNNNDVGGAALATGNTIQNFGGGAAANPSAAIRTLAQYGINVSYNTVNNNTGANTNHATTFRGIYLNTAISASATISNNTITMQSGATTSTMNAIENASGGTAASNTININTNIIRLAYTTATSGVLSAITNSASAATVNINNNNIQGVPATNYPSTGTINLIVAGSPGGPLNIMGNTLSNFTLTGASGTFRGINGSTPTGLYTISGNTVENFSYTTVASTGSLTGIYNLASATLMNVNNNIVRNFSTPTTGTLNGIQQNTVGGTFQCKNNQIYNFSTAAGGAGGFTANGITWSNATCDLSNNIIYAINSTGTTGGTGGTINGITHSGASTVSRNAIYDLSSNSTGATVNGLVVAATGTNNVNNNLIGDLRAPNSTGNIAISGMLVSGGTTNNIFHNTVNIASTTTSVTTFGTSAIYFSSTTPVNNLRNNIFVNTSAPGPTGGFTAAIRYTAAPTSTNFPAANNNNFYNAGTAAANKVLYCENATATPANGQQTIANYKTYINTTLPVAGREAASVSEVPNWVSTTGSNPVTTFLQYNTGIATQIEQGGVLGTGITTDYTGTTVRCPGGGCPGATATPDMGAWELNGTILDLSAPTISYTALSNYCLTGARTLTTSITDASNVPTSGIGLPVAYFKIGAGAYTPVTAIWTAGSTYTFSIGAGSVSGDVVSYYIVAQDMAGTPNVGAFPSGGAAGFTANPPVAATAPTTPSSYSNLTSLAAGIYGVGGPAAAGEIGHYATITAAVADYNSKCLAGNIVFALTDAAYSAGETFPITINANPAADATHTLTIKPDASVIASISGANTVSILKLNGAKYVTFDGSNNGSTSRDLTITNTSTGSIIWIGTDATTGATNNTIKNTNMIGPGAFGGQGIIAGSGTTFGSAAESGRPNSDNTIRNCTSKAVGNAIFALGDATTPDQNWLITQNNFGSTIVAEKLSFRGIAVQGAQNFTISNNIIRGIVSSTSSSATMTGILVGAAINTGTVSGNTISDIKQTNTTGWGSNGIMLSTSTTASGVTISNNLISDVASQGFGGVTVSDNGYGIMIVAGGGFNIYHNTVNMGTNQVAAGSITAAINIDVAVVTAGSINLRDNIFSNAQTVGTRYAIYNASTASLFAAINYNDYAAANVGYLGSSRVTLANWQTATSQDANSIAISPSFVLATDPHLMAAGNAALRAGTPIAGITTDIDADVRSTVLPFMGADELVPLPNMWTGASSTNWSLAGNWSSASVPLATDDVIIPNVANKPALTGATTINSIGIAASAFVDISGQTFTVNGALTGPGTISGTSASNLSLAGSAATLNFTAGSSALNDLTLGAAGAAVLGTALDIYGTVGFTAGGSLNMNAKAVTLKSNAANTARIANLTGSSLTGATNVTMERWIPLRAGGTGRAYRLLAPTVNTTGTMRANWMNGDMNIAVGTNVNTVPLYGTHITGAGGNTNFFDVTTSNASSAYFTANGVTPTYTAIGSTQVGTDIATLNAKTGYFLFVRGDRSMNINLAGTSGLPTSSTTLRTTGTLLTGTQTTFTNAFVGGIGTKNLVTNPYASTIDWSLIQPACTGVTGSYTYWDANIGTRGGFATVTTGSVSTPATSATRIIQPGQAFFVEASGAPAPTVSIQEIHKVAGNNNGVFKAQPTAMESFRTELYFTEANGYRRVADGVIALYDNKYKAAVDADDATEIGNWDENIAISRDGKKLAIEARPVITKSDDLPIYMNNMKKQGYEFDFTPSVFTNTGLKAELVDKFLGTRTLLSVTSSTTVAFTITDNPASAATDRFTVVFGSFGSPSGVDAITIKASQQNGGVQVDWTSKTETDMLTYEVEKSSYGTSFTKANSTTALGNSTTPVNYNWFDTNPIMGNNFYRIKGIDKAGNVRYSDMVKVLFGKGEPGIVVYPNPLQGKVFQVDMNNLAKGTYLLNLYNTMGQKVYSEKIQHDGAQAATKTIDVNMDLEQGAYQLQLIGDNGFKTTKSIIKN